MALTIDECKQLLSNALKQRTALVKERDEYVDYALRLAHHRNVLDSLVRRILASWRSFANRRGDEAEMQFLSAFDDELQGLVEDEIRRMQGGAE